MDCINYENRRLHNKSENWLIAWCVVVSGLVSHFPWKIWVPFLSELESKLASKQKKGGTKHASIHVERCTCGVVPRGRESPSSKLSLRMRELHLFGMTIGERVPWVLQTFCRPSKARIFGMSSHRIDKSSID